MCAHQSESMEDGLAAYCFFADEFNEFSTIDIDGPRGVYGHRFWLEKRDLGSNTYTKIEASDTIVSAPLTMGIQWSPLQV